MFIELVKPADLRALAAIFSSLDFAAKLEEAGEVRRKMPVRFTDEPSDPEARFRFYDRLMRERPDRPECARRKEAQYRKARRRL